MSLNFQIEEKSILTILSTIRRQHDDKFKIYIQKQKCKFQKYKLSVSF